MHSSPPVTEHGHLRCCTVCSATFRTDFERCPLDGGSVVVADVDPLVGATVGGHYEIEALIGVGAMGRVYRAHHTRLVNKRYAVKVLFGELTASPTMRMRFAHEAESASKLEHVNIVGVLDFGCTESGLMYLVMDLVEGPTLGGLIDQGPMSPVRVVSIARQLCAGLAHAHARGIVHRDFKPDNILVSTRSGAGEGPGAEKELLRIADFGLAISLSDDEEQDARLTGTGVLCTPTYAAPEQLLGKDIDHRADLYALGVTLYEMLTGGVLPFARGSQEVMLWKVTTEWPAVSARAPKAPRALADLLRRLLAREPEARPASAQEVLDRLDKLAAAPLPVPASPGRWRRPVLFAAPLALAGVVTGVVWLAHEDHAPASTEGLALTASVDSTEEAILGSSAPSAPPPAPIARVSPAPAPRLAPQTDMLAPQPETLAPQRDQPAPQRDKQSPSTTAKRASTQPASRTRARSAATNETSRTESLVPSGRGDHPPLPAPAAQITPAISVEPAAAPAVAPPPMPAPPTVAASSPEPIAAPAPAPRVQIARVAAPPVAQPRPPRIVSVDVSGALASSVVRRALERVLPALDSCSAKVGARVVSVRFGIEETRRAVNVHLEGAGAACVAATLGTLRTAAAPDVGEVTVTVRISFGTGA